MPRELVPVEERPGWAVGPAAQCVDPDTLEKQTTVRISRRILGDGDSEQFRTYEITLPGHLEGEALTAAVLHFIDAMNPGA